MDRTTCGPVDDSLPMPSTAWQARARAFLAYAQGCLWAPTGAVARGYLREARGLDEATIRRAGLVQDQATCSGIVR
jgi:hypothetical protein